MEGRGEEGKATEKQREMQTETKRNEARFCVRCFVLSARPRSLKTLEMRAPVHVLTFSFLCAIEPHVSGDGLAAHVEHAAASVRLAKRVALAFVRARRAVGHHELKTGVLVCAREQSQIGDNRQETRKKKKKKNRMSIGTDGAAERGSCTHPLARLTLPES